MEELKTPCLHAMEVCAEPDHDLMGQGCNVISKTQVVDGQHHAHTRSRTVAKCGCG
jgi:hypothetical protein